MPAPLPSLPRTRTRRRIARALGVACALAITLASCGDDSGALGDASAPPAGDPTTAVPETSDAPGETTTTGETATTAAAPGASVPADPCSLVTQEEANALAGREVQAPVASGAEGDSSCTFPTPLEGSVAQVEVFVGPGALKFLEIDRDVLGHEFTSVDGIGDEALQEDGVIFFRVDDVWVALRLTTLAEDPDQATRMQDLARVIVERLQAGG
jgi:hypothetical protein